MLPTSIIRQFAAAVVTLFGYPPTVSDDLQGRLLG